MSRIFLSAPDITGRERALVQEAFDSNYIAPVGEMLSRFEAAICEYTGFEQAVALSSGTAALHLALHIAGVRDGDEVWTTSMTFIGGVSPITYCGARPVFFDVDPSNWTIDPNLLDEQLTKAAADGTLPAALLPTDIYGQSCDLDPILDLGARFGVPVITDSAESLGGLYNGRHSGKGAMSAALSFNGNKLITTSGGGMLVSDDKALIDRARYLSTQARHPVVHYEHTEIGYNYRLSNVCAAIGLGQLEQIEDKIARRRAHFDRYKAALGGIDGVDFMPEPEGRRSNRWLTCMTLPDNAAMQAVVAACADADIEVRPLWKPMHMQPVFEGSRMVGGAVCEDLFDRGVCLPSGSGMSPEDHARVVSVLQDTLS